MKLRIGILIVGLAAIGGIFWLATKNVTFFGAKKVSPQSGPIGVVSKIEGELSSPTASTLEIDTVQNDKIASATTAVASLPKAENATHKKDVAIIKEVKPATSEVVATSSKITQIISVPTAKPVPTASFNFDKTWRDAIVNPLCSGFGYSSGSGVIIDKRGVVLTNAHVAQSFLFHNWPDPALYDCSIRIGSPAQARYRAKILYIPDRYIEEDINGWYSTSDANYIYGRKDYALLYITERTDPTAKLPAEFTYLPPYIESAAPKASFGYLIGYPASYLSEESLLRYLYMLSSPVFINEVKSLVGGTTGDVISFKGSIAGQHGSSGGAFINQKGEVAALITFFDQGGQGTSTSDNILNATTLDYIDRDIKADTGLSLKEFLEQGDFARKADELLANKLVDYRRRYAEVWRKNQDIILPGVIYDSPTY